MRIRVGDKFKTTEDVYYTVTKVDGDNIHWDCIGKKFWYKIVNLKSIAEWMEDKRLIRVN